ncbi:hypothetical protein D4764_18G0002660 [Takifugu flavidus]|uniref:Uncharacterized protein n=1 Tax=Takifugu flavidus TaxID=433684 RepID=A0A5C6NTN1_9TELE|nr:hypothetical protein D4764_18G0002660 [Takifugu flavidus]
MSAAPHAHLTRLITATSSTSGLAATARDSHLDNGGAEHGPFRLNVPYCPQNTIKALSEVGVEDQSDGSSSFPAREVTFHVPKANFHNRGSDRKAPALVRRPIHTAPDPSCSSCGWWVHCRRKCPHSWFGLGPAGPMDVGPATRRSPSSPSPKPGSRVGPR